MASTGPSALEGIRVLELGHAIAGPQATQILADHGADVIKIEPPDGELARNALPRKNGESIYYATHNRNKRSVVLNLKSEDGIRTLYKLVETADLIITNYSPAVPERLGWSYKSLRKRNPRLIFVHITGFGKAGPNRNKRAFDGAIQSMSGIADYTGTPDSGPTYVGAFMADHVTAYNAAMAALFALHRRSATGEGEFVEIDMLSSYMATGAHAVGAAVDGQPLERGGNRVATAFSNAYEAVDGFIFVSPVGRKAWKTFQKITRIPEISDLDYEEAIGKHRDTADASVARWCLNKTRAEISSRLDEGGVTCAPIRTMTEATSHALAVGTGAVIAVRSPAGEEIFVPGPLNDVGLSEGTQRHSVAALGQHTNEVLSEVGMPNYSSGR